MSLLSEAMETCTLLNVQTTTSEYGGSQNTVTDGDEFECAIVFDTSMGARVADKAGVTSRYTVTTSRTFVLNFHDVFRRERDGKVFRVTSDGDDKFTPASAGLDMRQVTAEEFVIPQEVTP